MAKPKTGRGNLAMRLAMIRQWHVYLSVFIAPSLMMFAITGAFQTFRVPDDNASPVLLQQMARVHKDDVFQANAQHVKKKAPEGPKAPEAPKPPPPASKLRLQWFFVGVSIGIVITTLLGLWMAISYNKRKAVIWAVLLAGIAAPVLILLS